MLVAVPQTVKDLDVVLREVIFIKRRVYLHEMRVPKFITSTLAMSDVSDVAPLPSTPSRNGDHDLDIGMSPGGGI